MKRTVRRQDGATGRSREGALARLFRWALGGPCDSRQPQALACASHLRWIGSSSLRSAARGGGSVTRCSMTRVPTPGKARERRFLVLPLLTSTPSTDPNVFSSAVAVLSPILSTPCAPRSMERRRGHRSNTSRVQRRHRSKGGKRWQGRSASLHFLARAPECCRSSRPPKQESRRTAQAGCQSPQQTDRASNPGPAAFSLGSERRIDENQDRQGRQRSGAACLSGGVPLSGFSGCGSSGSGAGGSLCPRTRWSPADGPGTDRARSDDFTTSAGGGGAAARTRVGLEQCPLFAPLLQALLRLRARRWR